MLDRVAKYRQDAGAVAAGGTSLWARADAAGDETFENTVKGERLTAADTKMKELSVWANQELKAMFEDLTTYFRSKLGLTSPYWDTYLASVGWRVPYGAAEALVEAKGAGYRLAAQYVFPKGTLVESGSSPLAAGMHRFGRITGTTGASTFAADD